MLEAMERPKGLFA